MTPRASILGVDVSVIERSEAADAVIEAALTRTALGVSALAVHGVMEGVADPAHLYRLNDLELVVADGQPVRWALRWLHGHQLLDRVYGPDLMADICERAARHGLPIFLFGSTEDTLTRLAEQLTTRYQGLTIAGSQPSRFRSATAEERDQDLEGIRDSGAAITFVGLGCPRQEIWTWETRHHLSMPVIAVGAAFDFHAGKLRRAPAWMQDRGLEWLYRLIQEPRRLWKRYLMLNPSYLWGILRQKVGLHRSPVAIAPSGEIRPG